MEGTISEPKYICFYSVLIACELLYAMLQKKKTKTGYIVLKLNMTRRYDMIK